MKQFTGKMCIFKYLLAVLLAVVLFTPEVAEAAELTVTSTSRKDYTASANGETIYVTLSGATTNTQLMGKPSWITQSGSSSSYKLVVAKNTSKSSRTGDVVYRAGNKVFTVRITQNGTPTTVTVKFNNNGGRGNVPNSTYTIGKAYGKLPAGSTPPTGKKFSGWYTKPSGGTKVTTKTKASASVTVLYAHYTNKTYTVKFDSCGGSKVSSKTVTYGANYGKLTTPKKTGYNFKGWFTAASGGKQVTEKTKMSTAVGHTLYAHWTPATYTITFDSQGGSAVPSRNVAYNGTYGDLRTPTRDGYTFLGWFTETKDGTQVTSTTKMTKASAHTLYAHWKGNPVKVTFDNNGGTGNVPSQTYIVGDAYGKLPAGPTKANYEFVGWSIKKDSGNLISTSTKVTSSVDYTVYANWRLKNPAAYNGSYNNKSVLKDDKKYAHNFYSDPVLPSGEKKYDGFYIEFKANDAPKATYWALCNWNMNLSNETVKYKNSYGKPYGAYAGFQVLSDGSKKLIFSVWDGVKSDGTHKWVDFVSTSFKKGQYTAENVKKSGEGSYTKYLFDYNWSADKWYGMYLSSKVINGETHVSMWVYDISASKWTHVITVNTHLKNSCMEGSMGMFMENFNSSYRESLRSCFLRNIHVHQTGKKWTGISKFNIHTDGNTNKLGSFAFNSYSNYIWAYTTGYGKDTYNGKDKNNVYLTVSVSSVGSLPSLPK